MRYSKDHKLQTREKMVQVASRKFRQEGFDGVSIGDLMAELKLTHGGFYRHFSTKEQLYTEALTCSIGDAQTRIAERAELDGDLTLHRVITAYLSSEHCAGIADGCPVAALSAEVARQSASVQSTFDEALAVYMETFLPLMPGKNETERKQQFLVLFSGMAGALSAARAASDPRLRQSILESARDFYIETFCEER
ncbi:MAG: TetR/AcrR family transcriptional regulator [Chloroflexota bacterium]